MLARPLERGERLVDVVSGERAAFLRLRLLGRVERQRRRPAEGRAHEDHRAEDVRPQERAPGGDRRAEIMSDHRRDRAMAERRDEAERVPRDIQEPERGEVAVIIAVPPRGAAIASLIGRDDVIARRRERPHHLAPGIGELGKAVQQEQQGPAALLVARLQHMHPQAIDAVDEARAYAGREELCVEGFRLGHLGSTSS